MTDSPVRPRDLGIGFIVGALIGILLLLSSGTINVGMPLGELLLRNAFMALGLLAGAAILGGLGRARTGARVLTVVGAAWIGYIVGALGTVVMYLFAGGPIGP